ncbi:MAG: flagellar type III secretion system pore protein FliP [Planctomycetota bacterium]
MAGRGACPPAKARRRRRPPGLAGVVKLLLLLALALLPALPAAAAEEESWVSRAISGDPEDLSVSLRILALLTILSVAPSILLLTTAFPRIVIVLGFVRRALSTQEVPPNQVIIGLAMILTFMVMAPTWSRIYDRAIEPYMSHEISDGDALRIAVGELRQFMFKHTEPKEMRLMVSLANAELIDQYGAGLDGDEALGAIPYDAVPTFTVIPAFLLSELKRAFEMGFLIYLPFVVIDLVVSSTLISMGMLVLPPVLISLPFKILIFVLVDGWGKVVEQLILSFQV